jgi:hypothetical protein
LNIVTRKLSMNKKGLPKAAVEDLLLRVVIRVRAGRVDSIQADGEQPISQEELEVIDLSGKMHNVMEGTPPDGEYIMTVNPKHQRSLELPDAARHRHMELLSLLDTLVVRPLLDQRGHMDVLDVFHGPGSAEGFAATRPGHCAQSDRVLGRRGELGDGRYGDGKY